MHLFARACGSSFSPTPWRHRGTSTSHQSHVTRHAFFCFQQLTNCPICNSCALIMLQQWGGYPPRSSYLTTSFFLYFAILFGGILQVGGSTTARCYAEARRALRPSHRG